MVLLKRKPVFFTPLPSLSTVLQPVHAPPAPAPAVATDADQPAPKSKSKSKSKAKDEAAPEAEAEVDESPAWVPPDGKDDEEQLDKLLYVFREDQANGTATAAVTGKGKKAGLVKVMGQADMNGLMGKVANGHGHEHGEAQEAQAGTTWKVWDRECFYIPETGEIFTDYESYCARRAFYDQPLFQCEVSGKSSLDYFTAFSSEQREVRQLHTRFPRQLKSAVLSAVQFQIEGKLESLADKIFERFVNRFFDEESESTVFVEVEGDKYLARIVKTFPPRSLAASTSASPLKPTVANQPIHPFASDLSLDQEEVIEKDDPMRYFYNVRLIEEGAQEGVAADYASANGQSHDGEGDEKWGGSVMEVQADKISRDRINFSRAMLKRFIRDCVHRDAAVYSPWLVKPSVAARYGIPTEMPDEIREGIQQYRERQMDKRKREREERLGIVPGAAEAPSVHEEEEEKPKKRRTKKAAAAEPEVKVEEVVEEKKKKKPLKYPAEDLLVEWNPERDPGAGRTELRPPPNRTQPFADQFETLLMTWSFLNVMGKPLHLSPFTLDDLEHSLYHNDSPTPLLAEIHSCLLNALVADLAAGHEPVRALRNAGKVADSEADNDTDYWEGKKGATTETLAPVATGLAESWKVKEISPRDGRRGWEAALVGCLWERATLDTLPNYLDNILHLTFEDKPAPTRPTWSTGPSTASSVAGLIPTKPEKRYLSLHHLHKLEIISFLTELVAQTAAIRDFMDESTAALTEVRKDQVEAKREYRRIQSERDALEPKEQPKENGEEHAEGEAEAEAEGDGDVSMSEVKEPASRQPSPSPSVNGVGINGTHSVTEHDELDESAAGFASDDEADSLSSISHEENPAFAGASRRKAMAAAAAEREAAEVARKEALARERELAKEKKAEGKHIAAEKKRLSDEEDAVRHRMRLLEHEFRSNLYTLRARPLGSDRYCNKVWWMDGLGSAPLVGSDGKVCYGTGRLYLQGAEDLDLEFARLAAVAANDGEEVPVEAVNERREKEEGEGKLVPGEWASYDTPEQLHAFLSYLNPKGVRESQLLKTFKAWLPELEGGMKRRRIAMGLEVPLEEEGRRVRMSRKAAGDEPEGFMNWKNKRASGRE